MVAIASSAITFALVFYTIGVFAERRAGTLKLSHIVFFLPGPGLRHCGHCGHVGYCAG